VWTIVRLSRPALYSRCCLCRAFSSRSACCCRAGSGCACRACHAPQARRLPAPRTSELVGTHSLCMCTNNRLAREAHDVHMHVSDLSATAGLARSATDALLLAASARAGGALASLNVWGCDQVWYGTLLCVVREHADTLRALRVARADTSGGQMYGYRLNCGWVTDLTRAAPQCSLLAWKLSPPWQRRAACCATSRRLARCA
jgi:hypothetical protein